MFKYQHASSGSIHWFIVACPCVSNPYSANSKETYAHGKNYLDLIALGFDLMEITARVLAMGGVMGGEKGTEQIREVAERAQDMKMQVGISSGPAAGVVMGRCRRFYCVYGDTINTAARMCASAKEWAVRVTAEIGGHASVAQSSWFESESLGKVWVKGKGDMVCA